MSRFRIDYKRKLGKEEQGASCDAVDGDTGQLLAARQVIGSDEESKRKEFELIFEISHPNVMRYLALQKNSYQLQQAIKQLSRIIR